MKKIKENIFPLICILFMLWIGYCSYHFSQNGRYSNEKGFVIDTHSGTIYYNDLKKTLRQAEFEK